MFGFSALVTSLQTEVYLLSLRLNYKYLINIDLHLVSAVNVVEHGTVR